jgi:hypothetical protein
VAWEGLEPEKLYPNSNYSGYRWPGRGWSLRSCIPTPSSYLNLEYKEGVSVKEMVTHLVQTGLLSKVKIEG